MNFWRNKKININMKVIGITYYLSFKMYVIKF